MGDDTIDRTLWCGNIHENVTEELLYELFLQASRLPSCISDCTTVFPWVTLGVRALNPIIALLFLVCAAAGFFIVSKTTGPLVRCGYGHTDTVQSVSI